MRCNAEWLGGCNNATGEQGLPHCLYGTLVHLRRPGQFHHRHGVEFARGPTSYPAANIDRLRGVRTEQIREVLGNCPYEEVVHRDNLVVIV